MNYHERTERFFDHMGATNNMNNKPLNFGDRFLLVLKKLNAVRPINEKEFTKEYICYQAGVDVNAINACIDQGLEPSVEDKKRLAKTIGINKDWLVFWKR